MNPEDILNQFFGGGMGGGRRRGGAGGVRPQRGSDIATELSIPFMDAVQGCERTVSVMAKAKCGTCDGSGSKDGSKPVTCTACGGTGRQSMSNGYFAVATTCRVCDGEGVTVPNPCGTCSGSGTVRKLKTVNVKVPAGVDSGITLRMTSEGDMGERGGPAGHLFVELRVQRDPFFKREGADIHITVPLSISQAVLGTTIAVPTVTGEVDLKIPAGTQPTDKLLMRGRGVKRLDTGTHGSQFVHVQLQVPKKLTAKQRELMEEYSQEESGQPASPKHSFLQDTIARIKKALSAKERSDR